MMKRGIGVPPVFQATSLPTGWQPSRKRSNRRSPSAALAIRGAEERRAPILMTALTAALALLPLIVAGNQPGHEIEYPMV